MLLENYDEQAVREVFRKDGMAEGMAQGMAQGMDKGKAEDLARLMKNGNFSEDQACELLGIVGDERTRLLQLIKEKSGQR